MCVRHCCPLDAFLCLFAFAEIMTVLADPPEELQVESGFHFIVAEVWRWYSLTNITNLPVFYKSHLRFYLPVLIVKEYP